MQAIFGQTITLVKIQLPSLRTNKHRSTGLQQYSNLPISAHFSEQKITKLEDYYNLKGIQKQEE